MATHMSEQMSESQYSGDSGPPTLKYYDQESKQCSVYAQNQGIGNDDFEKYLNLEPRRHAMPTVMQKVRKRLPPAQRDYKKNICRNLVRQAIKSMVRGPQLLYLHEQLGEDTEAFIQRYQMELSQLGGFRKLKAHLQDLASAQFQRYLIWFLQRRASLFVLNGESNDMKAHLRYKNEVMLIYSQLPSMWCSNEPIWRQAPQE